MCAANAAYLLRGERVLHEVEADRAHEFAAESPRGDGDHRGVRHHLVRLAVQLVQAQLWGEKEGGREREEGGRDRGVVERWTDRQRRPCKVYAMQHASAMHTHAHVRNL